MSARKPPNYPQILRLTELRRPPLLTLVRWKERHSSWPVSECRKSHCPSVWCITVESHREHLVTHSHGIPTRLAPATGSLYIIEYMVGHYPSVVLGPSIPKDHSLHITLTCLRRKIFQRTQNISQEEVMGHHTGPLECAGLVNSGLLSHHFCTVHGRKCKEIPSLPASLLLCWPWKTAANLLNGHHNILSDVSGDLWDDSLSTTLQKTKNQVPRAQIIYLMSHCKYVQGVDSDRTLTRGTGCNAWCVAHRQKNATTDSSHCGIFFINTQKNHKVSWVFSVTSIRSILSIYEFISISLRA